MELVYPPTARLSEEDKTSICYLAFPDSNSGCMGDTRLRHSAHPSVVGGGGGLVAGHARYNKAAPVSLQATPNYLYGFVYFRQVKDPNLPRGYFQKSVILLSRLPFVNLFLEVCGKVAPRFFRCGLSSLEEAWCNISKWPFPEPGESTCLSLLGEILNVQIPSDSSQCNIVLAQHTSGNTISPVHLLNLFSCFSTCVYHIHLLWELVLTGEPIVVMGSSPETCSQMVHALVSMIMPLRYCAEHRPYFTIHDSEFKEYTKTTHAPPPIILGVTNPFFSKTLQHWPHIVKLAEPVNKAGVYTQYEPFLHRDKAIVKKLLKGVATNRPEEVQSALLRRHLLELTQSFMIPLERYMGTLMPLHKNISPYRAAPTPWPFDPDAFLASLDKSGPQLTTGIRGNWVGLYRRFFRSPNFDGWYRCRYKAMSDKLQALQLESLAAADLGHWVRDKQEVEVVDMLLRIRCRLQESSRHEGVPLSEEVRHRLRMRMDEIVCTLPEDLRTVLNSNTS
ncbi:hypothetical protein AAG570_009583 [Ranatra chinensis]|uniref:UDENN domain-containing protein n=1 Tax=Ranatra chinensis TaxID=642074 RepID=A0ABD0Z2G9_9HEMI